MMNLKKIFMKKNKNMISAYYGRLYNPYYNLYAKINDNIPDLYNTIGEKLEIFFIRDAVSAHNPYALGSIPTKFLFDRYNINLKTHFYSHHAMLETMGFPVKRYGLLIESKSIVPNDYEIFEKHKGLNNDFDLIFTHDYKTLNEISNARFVPWCANLWYGSLVGGGVLSDSQYTKKNKNVSIVSSDKEYCDLHKFRIELARECKRFNLADTFGTFDGGDYAPISESLADYKYSIVIENEISPLFFTEKLTNCFASMTVPIYLGATEIDNFFNPDGIIKISQTSDIRSVLLQCSDEDYYGRINAIKDNYERVQKYRNIADWMYEEYLK